jgi:pantetheine-phosphate adenylyltransferase
MARTKALYPGSFDPPTRGHLDILLQAGALFNVTVVVGVNGGKKSLLEREERVGMFHALNHTAIDMPPEGESIIKTAERLGAGVIVRGIRGPDDLPSELAYKDFIESASSLQVVHFVSDMKYRTVSSTAVREILKLDGWRRDELLAPYVPLSVAQLLGRL